MYVNIPARIPQKPLPVFSNGSSGPLVHGRLIYWVTGVINFFIGVKPSAQEVWSVQMRMLRNLKFRGIDLLREKFNPQKQTNGRRRFLRFLPCAMRSKTPFLTTHLGNMFVEFSNHRTSKSKKIERCGSWNEGSSLTSDFLPTAAFFCLESLLVLLSLDIQTPAE